MAAITILSVDVKNRVVIFDQCVAEIETLLDIDGEETKDPMMAMYVIARVPDEFPVPGGQYINITVEAYPTPYTVH
jgi:hypothetical protein